MELQINETIHPQYRIYTTQIDSETNNDQVKSLLRALEKHLTGGPKESKTDEKGSCVVIGNQAVCDEAVTVSEYFIRLWRRHRLHSNERQTVLSTEDQMVVVQLCLAGINKEKIGDFDVEASTVIEMHKSLQADKMNRFLCLDSQGSASSDEFVELRQAYDSYLTNCNMIDIIDVFTKIREELTANGDLLRDLTSSNILVINKPHGPVEMEMMKFLAGRRSGVQISKLCTPLGCEIETEKVFVELEESPLEKALDICEDIKQSPASVTEIHVKGVILSYLQLLVNSRSELGLARALNVPDRELDHKAFTALKKDAKSKGLSMYQTATSFIMRLRMGGSGYDSSYSSLNLHVKGLSEFIDMMHKLQTIIEEETNTAKAVKRVINIIKTAIKKHRDNLLRPESVEKVATQLQECAALLDSSLGSTNFNSPNRPANMGGSMLGRDTLRVMRHLLDTHAGIAMVSHSVEILSDAISSQKTPLRFSSLLSKFRSPVEVTPDGKIEKSLTERMVEKMSKKPKVSAVPRYQASYDWAQPLHNIGLGERQTNSVSDYIPSKSMVCPAEGKAVAPRRILESVQDQENIVVTSGDAEEVESSQTTNYKKTNNQKTQSKKRPAGQENASSAPPQKKSKAAPRQNKKKTLALQKGQKQLTSFFRM